MNKDIIINAGFLNDIEMDLSRFLKIIEKPSPETWFFEFIENELLGFISCELNEEDIDIPTISIALIIADITNASRQQIIDLFSLNTQLHACSLSIVEFGDQLKLTLNRRIIAESYQSGELQENTNIMLIRLDIFFPEIRRILESE
jgi:hypothetical protein